MAVRRRPKREFLLQQMPTGGVCAEIGVWQGDFSARILEVTRPRLLHLIDPWRHEAAEAYKNAWYGGRLERGQAQMDDIYRRVVDRFAAEARAGRVVIHRAPSAVAVAAFADAEFDSVYVDGNHLYEFVKLDLDLWRQAALTAPSVSSSRSPIQSMASSAADRTIAGRCPVASGGGVCDTGVNR